jgi:hypothetical protein
MNWFPQIGAGSVAQFPVTRSRQWRAITNSLESGGRIMLPDTTAGQIQWKLSYRELQDLEVQSLSDLFTASQGEFGAFTFIDPLANLLGWSENLAQSAWQAGLLTSSAGMADPLGTARASAITNSSPGTQSLQQTLGLAGNYVTCFSVYVRSDSAGAVTLLRDNTRVQVSLSPVWKRVYVSGVGATGVVQSTFSITLSPGQTIDVFGLQVEAQPYPSAYKQTTAALGIYEETYFGEDELKITSTSPGLSSCEISLVSRV